MRGFAIDGEIALDGELIIYRAAEAKSMFLASLGDPGPLDINLSRVTELDSAGVQLLIWARHLCEQRAKPLRIIAPSAAVLDVLQLLDLNGQFVVVTSGPQADA